MKIVSDTTVTLPPARPAPDVETLALFLAQFHPEGTTTTRLSSTDDPSPTSAIVNDAVWLIIIVAGAIVALPEPFPPVENG